MVVGLALAFGLLLGVTIGGRVQPASLTQASSVLGMAGLGGGALSLFMHRNLRDALDAANEIIDKHEKGRELDLMDTSRKLEEMRDVRAREQLEATEKLARLEGRLAVFEEGYLDRLGDRLVAAIDNRGGKAR